MNCDTLITQNKYNAKDLLRRTHAAHVAPPFLNVVHLKASKRRLVAQTTSVLHTNGVDEMLEDCSGSNNAIPKYQMFVPWLGVSAERRRHFEISDNIMIDIDGESTRLPIFCHLLHVNEGGTTFKKTCKRLMRDACIQFGASTLPLTRSRSTTQLYSKSSSSLVSGDSPVFNVWSSDNEYYSTCYYYKNWRMNRDLFMKYNKSVQATETEFAVHVRTPPRSRDVSPIKPPPVVAVEQQLINSPLPNYSTPLYVVPPPIHSIEQALSSVNRSVTPRSTPLTPILKSTPTPQAAPQTQETGSGLTFTTSQVTISTASTGTDEDFFAYLRVNKYPTTQLDLPHSIEMAYTKSRVAEYNARVARIRYRKLVEGLRRNPSLKQIYMKQYECPLSGVQRSSLVMPFESGYDLLNGEKAAKKAANVVENYEEYYVIENAVDTCDIERLLNFDLFTCSQLLSNRAVLESYILARESAKQPIPIYVTPNPEVERKFEKIHQSFVETSKELEQLKTRPTKSMNETSELLLDTSLFNKYDPPLSSSSMMSSVSCVGGNSGFLGDRTQRTDSASSKSFKDLIEMINKKFEEINDLKDKYCMMDDTATTFERLGVGSAVSSTKTLDYNNNSQASKPSYVSEDFYKSQQPLRSRAYSSYKLSDINSNSMTAGAEESSGEVDTRSRRAQNEFLKSSASFSLPPLQLVKVKSKSSDHKCELIYSKFDQLIRNACDLSSANAKMLQDASSIVTSSTVK